MIPDKVTNLTEQGQFFFTYVPDSVEIQTVRVRFWTLDIRFHHEAGSQTYMLTDSEY